MRIKKFKTSAKTFKESLTEVQKYKDIITKFNKKFNDKVVCEAKIIEPVMKGDKWKVHIEVSRDEVFKKTKRADSIHERL